MNGFDIVADIGNCTGTACCLASATLVLVGDGVRLLTNDLRRLVRLWRSSRPSGVQSPIGLSMLDGSNVKVGQLHVVRMFTKRRACDSVNKQSRPSNQINNPDDAYRICKKPSAVADSLLPSPKSQCQYQYSPLLLLHHIRSKTIPDSPAAPVSEPGQLQQPSPT